MLWHLLHKLATQIDVDYLMFEIKLPCPCRLLSFPYRSLGKESVCNVGDPGSTPGSGRSAGKGISYPLQYSCVPFVAQLVKNLSTVWETWVWSLGWEDPLEKGKATHSSIGTWIIHRVGHDWVIFTFTFHAGYYECT